MDEFARLAPNERRDIISEVAIAMGVDFTIVEKDFWVCWVLQSLFSLSIEHPSMVFKGGTSLSKAYAIIHRFSEDIDVVTAVDFFLARGLADPEDAPSKTQGLERMTALDDACADYVASELIKGLRGRFADRLGTREGWELSIDLEDRFRHSLLFRYPTSASDIQHSYIRQHVKIELGWRSSTTPAESRTFLPYITEQFPTLMTNAEVTGLVLLPQRTFWEKVTALHAESFRDELPHFFSRHYSDVAAMFQTDVGRDASRDLSMLEDVRKFKQLYYPTGWARYDLAVPGTLRIVPSASKLRAFASDYREMRMMFFTEPASFEKVMEELDKLQDQINRA